MRLTQAEYDALVAKNKVVKKSKYFNIKVEYDSHKFDSKQEYKRYLVLRDREISGEIRDLKVHTKYKLEINGQFFCTYTDDFSYFLIHFTHSGTCSERIVEDVKAIRTTAYRLQKKAMSLCLGIEITEVNVLKTPKRK